MKRTVAVVAVVACISAFGLVGGAIDAPLDVGDTVSSLTGTLGSRSVVTKQPARAIPPISAIGPVVALVAFAMAGGAKGGGSAVLVGPGRRRIGDVGDDWRALLLGAPPRV